MSDQTIGERLDDWIWHRRYGRAYLLWHYWRRPAKGLEQWRVGRANTRRRQALTAHWQHANDEMVYRLKQQNARDHTNHTTTPNQP
jgi:hypothetical protein